MKTFKLISEHYSPNTPTYLMVGLNKGLYEVRLAADEPFTLLSAFTTYHEAYSFAEQEVQVA